MPYATEDGVTEKPPRRPEIPLVVENPRLFGFADCGVYDRLLQSGLGGDFVDLDWRWTNEGAMVLAVRVAGDNERDEPGRRRQPGIAAYDSYPLREWSLAEVLIGFWLTARLGRERRRWFHWVPFPRC